MTTMTKLLCLYPILLAHSFNAHAGPKAFNEKAVNAAIDQVIAEHKFYATCSSLDDLSLKTIKYGWERMVQETREELASYKPSTIFIAQFELKAHFDSLVDQNKSLGETMRYCRTAPYKMSTYYEFGFISMPKEVRRVLQAK